MIEHRNSTDSMDFAGAWMILQKRRTQRAKYLKTLYLLVGGTPLQTADHHDIALQAGLSDDWARIAFYDLRSQGLLQAPRPVGVVNITPQGVKFYEENVAKDPLGPVAYPYLGNHVHKGTTLNEPVLSTGDYCTLREVAGLPASADPLHGKGRGVPNAPLADEESFSRWQKVQTWFAEVSLQPVARPVLGTVVRFLLSKLGRH